MARELTEAERLAEDTEREAIRAKPADLATVGGRLAAIGARIKGLRQDLARERAREEVERARQEAERAAADHASAVAAVEAAAAEHTRRWEAWIVALDDRLAALWKERTALMADVRANAAEAQRVGCDGLPSAATATLLNPRVVAIRDGHGSIHWRR